MHRYVVLARAPFGLRLLVGAAVFYPGQTALGLVLLLTLRHTTGSFAPAGAAVAAETAGFSLSGLAQGRAIDRLGTRVIVPVTAACALVFLSIVVALSAKVPAAVLVVLAAAVGASIPATAPALRAVWSSLLEDPDQRSTAFAYQSLAQDVGFLIGPATFGAIAVTVSPQVALACCWALIAGGSLAVASVPASTRTGAPSARRLGPLLRALASLVTVMAVVGVALDATDVSTAAFAVEHHRPQLAGVLLACFSVGSIAGALAYGARTWRSPFTSGCSPARLRSASSRSDRFSLRASPSRRRRSSSPAPRWARPSPLPFSSPPSARPRVARPRPTRFSH